MSLGQLGFGLKMMVSSAKAMLFDLYRIKENDEKYIFYSKSSGYEEFFLIMLEKAGNPDRYRQVRNIAFSKKLSGHTLKESKDLAESQFSQYVDKNLKKITTIDFKIYSAIALIECEKQVNQIIINTKDNISVDNAAKIANMTGYMYACFFMLSTDQVESKAESKLQRNKAKARGEKTKAQILTEAISVLKSENSQTFFWDTENKIPGSLRISQLSNAISRKDSIDVKPQQIKTHLKELIKSGRLYPKKYYKNSQ